MASTGKLCDYESRHKELNLMYSKLGTSVNWNEHGKNYFKKRLKPQRDLQILF